MTATADILVDRRDGVLLVPNAALRFTPPKREPASRPSGGLVGMLLPRRPPEQKRSAAVNQGARVWVLREGRPEAVPVQTGASDGISTQVLEGTLEVGTRVLVHATLAAASR
jgi:HlyD family secretion protein